LAIPFGFTLQQTANPRKFATFFNSERIPEGSRVPRGEHAGRPGVLVYQGAIAFKLWTGVDLDVAVMRRALGQVFG
jgi:hypothetical protein